MENKQGPFFVNLDFKIDTDSDGQNRVVFVELNSRALLHADYKRHDVIHKKEHNAMMKFYNYLSDRYDRIFLVTNTYLEIPFTNYLVNNDKLIVMRTLAEFIKKVESSEYNIEKSVLLVNSHTGKSEANPIETQSLLNQLNIRIPVSQAALPLLRACGDKQIFYDVFKDSKKHLPQTFTISGDSIEDDIDKALSECTFDRFILKPSNCARAAGVIVLKNRDMLLKVASEIYRIRRLIGEGKNIDSSDIQLSLSDNEKSDLITLARSSTESSAGSFILQELIAPHDNRTGRVVVALNEGEAHPILSFWRHAPGKTDTIETENLVSILPKGMDDSEIKDYSSLLTEKEQAVVMEGVNALFVQNNKAFVRPIEEYFLSKLKEPSSAEQHGILKMLILLRCFPQINNELLHNMPGDMGYKYRSFLLLNTLQHDFTRSHQFFSDEKALPPVFPEVLDFMCQTEPNCLDIAFAANNWRNALKPLNCEDQQSQSNSDERWNLVSEKIEQSVLEYLKMCTRENLTDRNYTALELHSHLAKLESLLTFRFLSEHYLNILATVYEHLATCSLQLGNNYQAAEYAASAIAISYLNKNGYENKSFLDKISKQISQRDQEQFEKLCQVMQQLGALYYELHNLTKIHKTTKTWLEFLKIALLIPTNQFITYFLDELFLESRGIKLSEDLTAEPETDSESITSDLIYKLNVITRLMNLEIEAKAKISHKAISESYKWGRVLYVNYKATEAEHCRLNEGTELTQLRGLHRVLLNCISPALLHNVQANFNKH